MLIRQVTDSDGVCSAEPTGRLLRIGFEEGGVKNAV